MWRGCLCLVLLLACGKSNKTEEKKDAAPVAAPEPKLSDKSAADIMAEKVAKAKADGEAQQPPPPTPPPTPPPPPVTPPAPDAAEAMPPEEPVVANTGSGSDAAPVFKVGERVMAKWDNAKWYPGRIVGIKDGKYDVDYDDGDKSRGLVAHRVRKMTQDGKGSAK